MLERTIIHQNTQGQLILHLPSLEGQRPRFAIYDRDSHVTNQWNLTMVIDERAELTPVDEA